MLSEVEALALLKRHSDPLADDLWVNASFQHHASWTNNGWDHVDRVVRLLGFKSGAKRRAYDGLDVGAQLRLELCVAQAVSCCRGFEPAAQQDFWRRAVWPKRRGTTPTHAPVFTATTFTHVGIQCRSHSPCEDSFWLGLFHGTPKSNATFASVLEKLQPHLVGGSLPPLRMSVLTCSAPEEPVSYGPDHHHRVMGWQCAVTPEASKMIIRAALAPTVAMMDAPPTTIHVGLMIEYLMDSLNNSIFEILDLLAQVRFPTCQYLQFMIDQLVFHLASPPTARSESEFPSIRYRQELVGRSRILGRVLRTLLVNNGRRAPRVRRVAAFECGKSDFRLVGAVLSAVALASLPVEELRCSGLFDASRPPDQLLRLAWLAYALHRRKELPLALSLEASGAVVTTQECEYMEQLMANGMPLRDVVGEALRLRLGGEDDAVARLHVECMPFGSTVRLASGTKLYVEPMRVGDAFVVVTLDSGAADGEEVDLVAHVADHGGFVGVVLGGYGLVWADAACVVAWRCVDGDVVMTECDTDWVNGAAGKMAVSSLELVFHATIVDPSCEPFSLVHRASTLLSLFAGETLETLTLANTVVTSSDLAEMLESFPRLRMLGFDRCLVESLAPLADAYRVSGSQPRRARVAVLSLLGARDLGMRDGTPKYSPGTGLMLEITYTHPIHDHDRAVAWLAPLVDALVDGATDGVLQELHIDLMGLGVADQQAVVMRLAHAVSSSPLLGRSLTRLHVACHFVWRRAKRAPTSRRQMVNPRPLIAMCAAQLGPLRDVALRDPPRVRCATLSVLLLFGCAAPEIARAVLVWCEGDQVRKVTWAAS